MPVRSKMPLREIIYGVDVTNGEMTIYVVDDEQWLHVENNPTAETGLRRVGTTIVYDADLLPVGKRSRVRLDLLVALPINAVSSHADGYCDNVLWTWNREIAELVKKACRIATDRAQQVKKDSGHL